MDNVDVLRAQRDQLRNALIKVLANTGVIYKRESHPPFRYCCRYCERKAGSPDFVTHYLDCAVWQALSAIADTAE